MSSVTLVRPCWGEVVQSLELSGKGRIETRLATERIHENGIFGPSPDGAANARKETYEIHLVDSAGRAEMVAQKVFIWPDGVGVGGVGNGAHSGIYIYDADNDGKTISLALVSGYEAYVEQWERQETGSWQMKQFSLLGAMISTPEKFCFAVDERGNKNPRRIQIDAETKEWVPMPLDSAPSVAAGNGIPGPAGDMPAEPATASARALSSAAVGPSTASDSADRSELVVPLAPSPRGDRVWLYGLLGLLAAGMLVRVFFRSRRR